MNDIVKEWIRKADADFHSALREYRARNHPNYDSACFHAQQAKIAIKAMRSMASVLTEKL
ncbi:MAG: HEPN domain-containing protein [Bacteroidetes bacterium]|nr:HEPN domain-containing protein [Bacteroidota bacterium]